MEHLNETRVLKFRPHTLEAVRKNVNLDQPERMAEALDILENWVKMQTHFTKKDFPRDYLERTLIAAKGLVERAKEKLDKLCTFKTLMPELFAGSAITKEFSHLQNTFFDAHLPELTPDFHRVYVMKMVADNLNSTILFNFYKYLIMRCEYLKQFEYCAGFILILDYSDMKVLTSAFKFNPLELRQILMVMKEGYGLRIKSIHIITTSKMMDTILSILKQVFSAKLAKRIYTHKTKESIYEFVPKYILPSDYGGEAKSLAQLNVDWIDTISSKEYLEYFEEMRKAKTNESSREANKFNENYIGIPGSFRALSVD